VFGVLFETVFEYFEEIEGKRKRSGGPPFLYYGSFESHNTKNSNVCVRS
jgi:hypothetical protein